MRTLDPIAGGRAGSGSKPLRSGIARTLSRRAVPHAAPVISPGDGVPPTPTDLPIAAPPRPPNSGSGEPTGVRRSQAQLATLLARAVAQGHRNL
jgi:hypothetical protein